jgi:hypothetical protein
VAKSSLPSPSKSASAPQPPSPPEGEFAIAANPPVPFANNTHSKLALGRVMTRSCLPSPLRSPRESVNGVAPTVIVEPGEKAPRPLPRRIVIDPALRFTIARSSLPSPEMSKIEISLGPEPVA